MTRAKSASQQDGRHELLHEPDALVWNQGEDASALDPARYRRAIKQIDDVVYGIIRQRRESGEDPGDLLSRLLEARDEQGNGMTDSQLRDEAVTLILAGHETTALVMFYTFYLLSQSPEVEQRLASELSVVLDGRAPTAGDVPNLRYTEWVIRESMRLYPPAWAIAREALSDCEIGGYSVPKGTQIFPELSGSESPRRAYL